MNQRLLTVCLWISLLIHITVVLLLPAPSTVEASSTVAVHFAGAPPIEPEILPPEEAATEEAATEEFSSDLSAPVAPPEVESSDPADPLALEPAQEAEPEENPPVDAPEPAPAMPAPNEPAATPPAPPPVVPSFETLSEANAPLETPAEKDLAESTPEFDEAAVEELLQRTRDTVDGRDRETRYRLVEVRERIMRALESVHPGSSVVSGDRVRYRFLLSLRVDAEGYIFDLGLQVPPGSELDTVKIERGIVSISPLPPPPAGVKAPVEFEWRVDFLD